MSTKNAGDETVTERIWDKYLSDEDKAVFAASGYGAKAKWGKRPALLVVDINYAFTGDKPLPILDSIQTWRNSCGEYGWRAIPVVQQLLDLCRSKGIPVIYSTSTRRPDSWNFGSWAWKNGRTGEEVKSNAQPKRHNAVSGHTIVEEVAPGPRDIVIRKEKPSAFFGTPLQSYLQLLECDSLIVTGTTTSGCVRATVIDAFSQNFRCTVVEDGCFDRSQVSHAINLCDMNAKYANVLGSDEVMEYLRGLPDNAYGLPSGDGIVKGTEWY
jgi:nicotinamidase-related amidase